MWKKSDKTIFMLSQFQRSSNSLQQVSWLCSC